MTDAELPGAQVPVNGMPTELAEAISRVLDADRQQAATATWDQLRDDLRGAYRDYLDAPEWERWRQWRLQHAAHLLASGAHGPGDRGPLARWSRNLFATAGAIVGGGTPRWLADRLDKEDDSTRPV